jgi:hypothetical protein
LIALVMSLPFAISKNTAVRNRTINAIDKIAPETLVPYLKRIFTMTRITKSTAAKISR